MLALIDGEDLHFHFGFPLVVKLWPYGDLTQGRVNLKHEPGIGLFVVDRVPKASDGDNDVHVDNGSNGYFMMLSMTKFMMTKIGKCFKICW